MKSLAELHTLYREYVDRYRRADGSLPKMMQLKLDHTMQVVNNAKAIATGEGFAPDTAETCVIAALLHDVGRYEQLLRYNTFRDSESVDHAVFSHDIAKSLGWLDGRADRTAVLTAILFHNRRELPSDGMDERTHCAARTVRDADKLDIFRVLEHQIGTTDWRTDRKAFWDLDFEAPPNPTVVDCIRRSLPVDYQHIRSLADFVLIQVGWMAWGLEFATSRHLCTERNHLEYRRRFLKSITSDPSIDELCDLASARLVRK